TVTGVQTCALPISERLDQLRAHAGDAVEPRKPAEQTVLLAPRDDALGEGGTDAWQACDLRHVGAVEVDPLAREERACQAGGRARRRAQAARTGGRCVASDQANVARCRRGGGRERKTNARTGKGE